MCAFAVPEYTRLYQRCKGRERRREGKLSIDLTDSTPSSTIRYKTFFIQTIGEIQRVFRTSNNWFYIKLKQSSLWLSVYPAGQR